LYNGRRKEDAFLLLRCLPTPGQSSRWCLRVPKRLGNAPQRNRIRRLMREFIRTNKSIWPTDCAIVLSAKPIAQAVTSEQIAQSITELLRDE